MNNCRSGKDWRSFMGEKGESEDKDEEKEEDDDVKVHEENEEGDDALYEQNDEGEEMQDDEDKKGDGKDGEMDETGETLYMEKNEEDEEEGSVVAAGTAHDAWVHKVRPGNAMRRSARYKYHINCGGHGGGGGGKHRSGPVFLPPPARCLGRRPP